MDFMRNSGKYLEILNVNKPGNEISSLKGRVKLSQGQIVMSKPSLESSSLGQYLGTEFKTMIPKIPQADCPKSIVKLCEYYDIQHLEGQLKTLVDATIPSVMGGDDNKQNKALKDVVQFIVRDFWRWLNASTDGTVYKKAGYLCQLKERQENK